jgi:hypothetical protein
MVWQHRFPPGRGEWRPDIPLAKMPAKGILSQWIVNK